MSLLQWQQTDKNGFAVFIRDLTQSMNNVKHMIEDTLPKQPKKSHKKPKKVVKKKKDIIIEQQTKLRLQKQVTEDKSRINYLIQNLNYTNPYPVFQQMKTEEGLRLLKFAMLSTFWEKRKLYFPHVLNLYFQLVDTAQSSEQRELLHAIQSKLEDREYKLYMMKHLSHLLPPLNIHEPKRKLLDDWQIDVVNYIRQGESVVVKAPTSSGKSFVALSAGVFHKKVLFVCPAKPIAYQVGANFSLMGYKVHYLVDTLCYQSVNPQTTIFVGVPEIIEDNLYKLGLTFDYAVFDEIHNLNKDDDGHIYENLLKMIQCPFLALSATIQKIESLVSYLERIQSTQVHYIEYTKRFINQQKMVYSKGQLQKLHPLACISIDDLNDDFVTQNLQFTPYDSAILWETIEEEFESDDDEDFQESIDNCSPDVYFPDDHKILTLDDTRNYETFIKQTLVRLAKTRPLQVKQILSTFQVSVSNMVPDNIPKDILNLFRECKQKDCLPMLVFNTDTIRCKDIFTQLFQQIARSESESYPYHYDILEFKQERYQKYSDKRQLFNERVKIGNTNDAKTEKQTKLDRFDKTEEQLYVRDVCAFYETCMHSCERSDLSDSIKKMQIKNLKRELKDYQKYPTFGPVDVFQKHKEYCYSTSDPMSGDQIRMIRREIQSTLGVKLSYEHELFQMLKRGIGIYTDDMPEEYKWILQKLMDQKRIGIVISDRTLCLGIDLPIRSSVLLGLPGSKQFTIDDYLQMSGRAGRRGKDDRGNTIFYNLDYKQLMKGVLPEIRGSLKSVPNNYRVFPKLKEDVFNNPIHPDKDVCEIPFIETKIPKLQWLLRYQQEIPELLSKIHLWNKSVYNAVSESDKELSVFEPVIRCLDSREDQIHSLIQQYKANTIQSDYNSYKEFKQICRYLEHIHNSLTDKKYDYFKKYIQQTHSHCKDMILKYQGIY